MIAGVDFRQLVRELSHELHERIDMRQIAASGKKQRTWWLRSLWTKSTRPLLKTVSVAAAEWDLPLELH